MKSHFLGSVLVVVLGVNLAAWALSVGFSPAQGVATIPVTPQGLQQQGQTASAVVTLQQQTSLAPVTPTPNFHENVATSTSGQ